MEPTKDANMKPNKRMQMDRPKRCALVSATDAERYEAGTIEVFLDESIELTI